MANKNRTAQCCSETSAASATMPGTWSAVWTPVSLVYWSPTTYQTIRQTTYSRNGHEQTAINMHCDKCLREDKAAWVETLIRTSSSYGEVRIASRTPLLTQPKASEGLPCGSELKNPPASAETQVPGSGRPPGEGNGKPLQYSCLENPMDRGGWWATVHRSQRVGHNWATEQQQQQSQWEQGRLPGRTRASNRRG